MPKLPPYVRARRRRDGTTAFDSWIPDGASGRKRWLPTCDSAEEAVEMRRRAMATRDDLRPLESRWCEVVDATAEDLRERGRKPGTLDWFDGQVAAIRRALEAEGFADSMAFSRVTADVWRRIRDARLAAVSVATTRHLFRAASLVYSYAARRGLCATSPLVSVPLPAEQVREMDYLTEGEVWKVVDTIEASEHPLRLRDAAVVAVLFLTGLRRGELARARVGDVRADRRQMWVRGKRRDETMALAEAALPYLDRLAAGRDGAEPLVAGGVESIRRTFDRWRKRVPAAIGAKLHPHALRHSFVTALVPQLVARGRTEKEMLQLTRLRSLTTLHRYLHVTADPSDLDVLGASRKRGLRIVREE